MSNVADNLNPTNQSSPERGGGGRDEKGPFVMVDGRKVRIAEVDYGLIPPWDGFSLRDWWSRSRLNPFARPNERV